MWIDLNADVGEGCASDLALLEHVSSINIACGWHAGDALQMQSLVRAALPRGLAIGAHPGYPDREHFGRRELRLPPDEVRAGVLYQLGALDAIVRAEGGALSHVKPHGALYNQAAREPELARCLARAMRDHDPALPVVALAGSAMVEALRAEGLAVLQEGFADRGYARDGQLAPRGAPGALVADASAALAQAVALVKSGTVVATDGTRCRVRVDTICLHGDGPHALEFARVLRGGLADAGIMVRRPR